MGEMLVVNNKTVDLGNLSIIILAIAKRLGYTNRCTPEEKRVIKQKAIRTLYDYLGTQLN